MMRTLRVARGVALALAAVIATAGCSGGRRGGGRTTDPDLGRTHVKTDLPGFVDAAPGGGVGSGTAAGPGTGSGTGSGVGSGTAVPP